MRSVIVVLIGAWLSTLAAGAIRTGNSDSLPQTPLRVQRSNLIPVRTSDAVSISVHQRSSAVPFSDFRLRSLAFTCGSIFDREVLRNGGFETGSLAPWTSTNWIVDTNNPQKGRYCASDVGNYGIRQDFSPIPASAITSVTFWSRQPDAPAGQAYDFFYSDGSSEEFVVYPTASWLQYDVTSHLNRSKLLKGFQLWGYSGGGPAPDSTYVDEVSIKRVFDVSLLPLCPTGGTLYLGDTITPQAEIRNNGSIAESLWIWCRIEHTCTTDVYRESCSVSLPAGAQQIVSFPDWTPHHLGRYRAMFSFDPNDTNWYYFEVAGSVALAEQQGQAPAQFRCFPSIGRVFEISCPPGRQGQMSIYSATGQLVWSERLGGARPNSIRWNGTDRYGRRLTFGVYLVRLEADKRSTTQKLVIR